MRYTVALKIVHVVFLALTTGSFKTTVWFIYYNTYWKLQLVFPVFLNLLDIAPKIVMLDFCWKWELLETGMPQNIALYLNYIQSKYPVKDIVDNKLTFLTIFIHFQNEITNTWLTHIIFIVLHLYDVHFIPQKSYT